METSNPYAPPKAAVLDPPSPTGLKRRSVWLMILFTLVTLWLYYPIWFFRRRKALNALNSPRKVALWPLLLFAADLMVEIVLGIVSGERRVEQVIGTMPALLFNFARLVTGLIMIWQCFVIKDILEDHLSETDDGALPSMFVERVQLSGPATFFFSIFYLQYTINRNLARLQEGTEKPRSIAPPTNVETV